MILRVADYLGFSRMFSLRRELSPTQKPLTTGSGWNVQASSQRLGVASTSSKLGTALGLLLVEHSQPVTSSPKPYALRSQMG